MDSIDKIGGGKLSDEASTNEYRMGFPIPRAILAFAELRQVFTTASILHYYDPEC